MASKSKAFGTYTATMDDTDDGRMNCYINDNVTGASGSLAMAQSEGVLLGNGMESEVEMHSATLERIERWALANGY